MKIIHNNKVHELETMIAGARLAQSVLDNFTFNEPELNDKLTSIKYQLDDKLHEKLTALKKSRLRNQNQWIVQ